MQCGYDTVNTHHHHYHHQAKRIEQELEDRKMQMDQVLLKQKLYTTPIGAQVGSASPTARQAYDRINKAQPKKMVSITCDDKRNAVVKVLQERLRAAQEEASEQAAETQKVTAMYERAKGELLRRENDTERLYGLLLKRETGETTKTPLSHETTPDSPQTLIHVLNMQVTDLHNEVAALHAKLHEERQIRSDDAVNSITAQRRVAALETELETLRTAAATAQEEANTPKAEPEVVEPPTAEARLDYAQLVSDKEVLQRQLEILGNEVLESQRASADQLRHLVASQEKVNRLTKSGAALRERNDTLVLKLTAADAEIAHLTPKKVVPVVYTTTEVQTDALDEPTSTETQRAAKLIEDLSRMQSAVMDISEARDSLQVQLDTAATNLNDAESNTATLKEENEALYRTVQALQNELSGHIAKAREGESSLSAEASRASRLEGDLRCVSAERDELNHEILQASDDFRQMLRENHILSRQLQEAALHKDTAEGKLDAYTTQTAEAAHLLHVKEEEMSEIMLTYRQLCEEYEAMKRRLSASELASQRLREEAMEERRRAEEQRGEVGFIAQREQQTAVDLNSANYEIDALNTKVLAALNEKHQMQREVDESARAAKAAAAVADATERKLLQSERERALLANELDHTRVLANDGANELKLTSSALQEEQKEVRRLTDMLASLHKKEAALFVSAENQRSSFDQCKTDADNSERKLLDTQHELKLTKKKVQEMASILKTAQESVRAAESDKQKAMQSERRHAANAEDLEKQLNVAQMTIGVLDEEVRRRGESLE